MTIKRSFEPSWRQIATVSAGACAENQTQWLDKLRTTIGLRQDVFCGSDASTLSANSGSTAKGMLSPKLDAVLGPWRQTELYLSYQGFHSNDVRGALTTIDALQTEINQEQGNNTIVPQPKTPLLTKAVGYETGIRSHVTPALSATAALFMLDLDSEAIFADDQAETSAGRTSKGVGVELTSAYMPLPWLAFNGDVAFTRARVADADPGTADVEPGHPGSYIPEAAKLVAAAEMVMRNLGPWDAGLRLRYFGPRPLIEDGTVRSGPTALFDLRLGCLLTERVHLGLDVYNLFASHAHQIDYYCPSQLPNETAPVYDIHFKPVEPRSLRATPAVTF